MSEPPIEVAAPDIDAYRQGNTDIPYVTTFESRRAGPHVAITALVLTDTPTNRPLPTDWPTNTTAPTPIPPPLIAVKLAGVEAGAAAGCVNDPLASSPCLIP